MEHSQVFRFFAATNTSGFTFPPKKLLQCPKAYPRGVSSQIMHLGGVVLPINIFPFFWAPCLGHLDPFPHRCCCASLASFLLCARAHLKGRCKFGGNGCRELHMSWDTLRSCRLLEVSPFLYSIPASACVYAAFCSSCSLVLIHFCGRLVRTPPSEKYLTSCPKILYDLEVLL